MLPAGGNTHQGGALVAQRVKNQTSIHEEGGSIPGLAQRGKDLALLQAAALSQMQPRPGAAKAVAVV